MNGTEIITFLSTNFPTVMSTVGAVTGGLFTAIFLRQNTATTEFEKIKAGQFKEVADSLLESGKMTYTEYYKAKNFLEVAQKADELFAELDHTDEEQVCDFDWLIRFYEASGNISNEKMQELWAKILAGEINHPSTFSLRTIDTLKNLTSSDAELFEKLCSYSFNIGKSYRMPNYNGYLEKCNIHYEDIMALSELGLIYNDGNLVLEIKVSTDLNVLCHNKELLMTNKANDTSTEIKIKQFPFTLVGNQIASLINITTSNENFIDFANEINKNDKVDIGVYKIKKINNGEVEYEELNLIS
ncbi:DUF2806 domain-containing protein [Intestinibacter bartlettii]|uniref:DUF2806 domain-containing protein n=1 Tax=Intestinibacter bartlettii TaxID=261299 RepID=UPI00321B68CD